MKDLNLYEISDLLKSIFEKKYNVIPETFVTTNNNRSHQNLCKMEAPCFSYGEEIL